MDKLEMAYFVILFLPLFFLAFLKKYIDEIKLLKFEKDYRDKKIEELTSEKITLEFEVKKLKEENDALDEEMSQKSLSYLLDERLYRIQYEKALKIVISLKHELRNK